MNLSQYFALGWEALIFDPLYEAYDSCREEISNGVRKIVEVQDPSGEDNGTRISLEGSVITPKENLSETFLLDPHCTKLHAIGHGASGRSVFKENGCSDTCQGNLSSSTNRINSAPAKKLKTIPLPFLSARISNRHATHPLSPPLLAPTSSGQDKGDCRGKKAVGDLIHRILVRCVEDEIAYQKDIFLLEHYAEVKNIERLSQLLSRTPISSKNTSTFLRRVLSTMQQNIGGSIVAEHLSSAVRSTMLQKQRERSGTNFSMESNQLQGEGIASNEEHFRIGSNPGQNCEEYSHSISESQQRHLLNLLHDGVEYASILTTIHSHANLNRQSDFGVSLPPSLIETAPHGARYGDPSQLLSCKYPPPYLRESTFTLETLRLYTWLKTWRIAAESAAARRFDATSKKVSVAKKAIRRNGRKSTAHSETCDRPARKSSSVKEKAAKGRVILTQKSQAAFKSPPLSRGVQAQKSPVTLSSSSCSDVEEQDEPSRKEGDASRKSYTPSGKTTSIVSKEKSLKTASPQMKHRGVGDLCNGSIPALTIVSSSSSLSSSFDGETEMCIENSDLLSASDTRDVSGVIVATGSEKNCVCTEPTSSGVVGIRSPMLAYQEAWCHPRFPPALPASPIPLDVPPTSIHSTAGRVGYVDAYGNTLRSARLAAREAEMAAVQVRREKRRSRMRGYFPLSLSRAAQLIQEEFDTRRNQARSKAKSSVKQKRNILSALPSLTSTSTCKKKQEKKRNLGAERRSPTTSTLKRTPSNTTSSSSSSSSSSGVLDWEDNVVSECGKVEQETGLHGERKRNRKCFRSSSDESSSASRSSSYSSTSSGTGSSSTDDSVEDDLTDEVDNQLISNASKESVITNLAILSGSHGSGKTAAVYLAASLLHCRVVELNTSVIRTPKTLATLVAELTRSHQHMSNWKDPYYSFSPSTAGEQNSLMTQPMTGLASRSGSMRLLPPPPTRRRTIQEELERMKQQLDAEEETRRQKREREGVTEDSDKQSDESIPGKRRKKSVHQQDPQQKKKNAISAQAIASFFAPKKASTVSSDPPPANTSIALTTVKGADTLGSKSNIDEEILDNNGKPSLHIDEREGTNEKKKDVQNEESSTRNNAAKGTLAFFFSPKSKTDNSVESNNTSSAECCQTVSPTINTNCALVDTKNDGDPTNPVAPQRDASYASPSSPALSTILLVEDADVLLGPGEEQHGKALYAAIRDMAQESQIPIIVTANSSSAAQHFSAGDINSEDVGFYPLSGKPVCSSARGTLLSLLHTHSSSRTGAGSSHSPLWDNLKSTLLHINKAALPPLLSSSSLSPHGSTETTDKMSSSPSNSATSPLSTAVREWEREEEEEGSDDISEDEDDNYGIIDPQNHTGAVDSSSSSCRGVSPPAGLCSSSSGRTSPTSPPLFQSPPSFSSAHLMSGGQALSAVNGGGGVVSPSSSPSAQSRRGGPASFSPALVAQFFGPSAPLVYFTPPTRLSLYLTLLITGAVELQLLQRLPASLKNKKFKGETPNSGYLFTSNNSNSKLSSSERYESTILCIPNPSLFVSFSEFLEELVFGVNPSLVRGRKYNGDHLSSRIRHPSFFPVIPIPSLMRYKSSCSTTTDIRYWLNQLHFHLLLPSSQQRWGKKKGDGFREGDNADLLPSEPSGNSATLSGNDLFKEKLIEMNKKAIYNTDSESTNTLDSEHASLGEGFEWRWWWDVALGRYLRLYAQYHFPRNHKAYHQWLWENIYETPSTVSIPVPHNSSSTLFNSSSEASFHHFGLEKLSSTPVANAKFATECSSPSRMWTIVERSTLAIELHIEDASRVMTLRYRYLLSCQTQKNLEFRHLTEAPKEKAPSAAQGSKSRSRRTIPTSETSDINATRPDIGATIPSFFTSSSNSEIAVRGPSTEETSTCCQSSLKVALSLNVNTTLMQQLPFPLPFPAQPWPDFPVCSSIVSYPVFSSSYSPYTYDGGKAITSLMLPHGSRQRRLFSWLRLLYLGENTRSSSYAAALGLDLSSSSPHKGNGVIIHGEFGNTVTTDTHCKQQSTSVKLPLFMFSPPVLHHQCEFSRIRGEVPPSAMVIPACISFDKYGPANSSLCPLSGGEDRVKGSWNSDTVTSSSNGINTYYNNIYTGGAVLDSGARESVIQKTEDDEQALLFRVLYQGFHACSPPGVDGSVYNTRGRAQSFLTHFERELQLRSISDYGGLSGSENGPSRRIRQGKKREEDITSSSFSQKNFKVLHEKIAQSFIVGRDISSFEDILGFSFLIGRKEAK